MKQRRAGVFLVLAAAILTGSALASGAATSARTLRTTTPVDGLAADGSTVAVATAFEPGHCERVVAWNPAGASLRAVGPTVPCPATSTGRSILFQAVAGSRVAWVSDAGGNQHDSQLFVAALAKPQKARSLASTTRDIDTGVGTYVGHVHGSGSLLVYATWSVCDVAEPSLKPCPVGQAPETIYNTRLWRVDGTNGKQTLIASAADELAPLDVSAGRILVQRADGSLEIRKANGALAQTFTFPPGDVLQAVLGPSDLVVAYRDLASAQPGKPRLQIRDYDPVTGTLKRTFLAPALAPITATRCQYPIGSSPASCRLPAARFRLQDVDATRLVYVLDTTVHVVNLVTAAERSFVATGKTPVFAQLEQAGLVYSYSASGRLKGRVDFVPTRKLG